MKLHWLLCALLLGGCAFGDASLAEVDPGTLPARPTYAEHIRPMMDFYCAACHDPDGQIGAQEGIDLTRYDDIVDEFEEIAEQVFEERTMPPGGARRLSARDEEILARWAEQGFAP